MKMRTKIIIASIAILIAVGAVILIKINEKKGPTLICNYPSLYTNYTEELKFVFRGTVIEKFYRIETFTETDTKKLDEEEAYFKKAKENYRDDLGTFVKYYFEREDNKLTINTYIYVPRRTDFFDNFLKSKEITHFFTINKLKSSLEEENYSCRIIK